jgi:DNA polymerase-3 subunit delta'
MPFRSVIGHAQVVSLLRHAAARGRVPQSLVFAGPDGVGKRTVAVALAQAINCPRRKDGDACGECPTCQRIERGQHTDVAIIEKGDEASIKIKTLRERVLDVVGYRPFEAEWRVYILDPAEDITTEGQDALLKTLEEPPPAAILILVTAYPDLLLPTIQSRCRRLRFGPLSEADVARVLVERHGIARAQARALAAASGGSVARALDEKSGDLSDDREAAWGLLAAAVAGVPQKLKASAALAKNDSDRRDREALGMRLTILGSLLRDVGAIASGYDRALANADLESDLRSVAKSFTPARLTSAVTALQRAEAALDRNASPKIVADWMALHL